MIIWKLRWARTKDRQDVRAVMGVQIRSDFTSQIINTLKGGASDLVNADMNEESANLLSLQTRQQLGTISLSIAQKSEEAILRLF